MNPKKCAYCGEEFIPRSNHAIYCKRPHYMVCPVCGKKYLVTNNDKLKFPPTACSYPCRTILRTRTSIEKYGCTAPGNNPEARKKASETMMKNLGVPYAMMSSEIREKSKETLLKKYGVDNVGKNKEIREKRMQTERANHNGMLAFNTPQSYEKRKETVLTKYGCEVWSHPEVRKKIRETMVERYGHEHLMQVEELKAKQQATMLERYGVKYAFASPEIKEKIKKTMLERYGVENASYSEELCRKADQTTLERYGVHRRTSKTNQQFHTMLESNEICSEEEHFLQGKWFDFCIEELKIFIEVNPTYTHNFIGNHWGDGVPVDYHLNRTKLAKEFGYRCIHVWQWDDWNKIIALVVPRNHIYARKCKILKLYPSTANKFLQENDIHGSRKSQVICFGLVYEDELVQVMTFGRPRYDKKYDVELLRLCTKQRLQVVGGASKLFKFAMEYIDPDSVISYCDISKFSGDVYEKLGMNLIRTTPPQEIWSKGKEYVTANLLRQRGYDQLFKTDYGKGVSNEQLMLDNGWLPVFDCGQQVWEYKKS